MFGFLDIGGNEGKRKRHCSRQRVLKSPVGSVVGSCRAVVLSKANGSRCMLKGSRVVPLRLYP